MATVTKEQVFAACRELKQRHGSFTQADVVNITGGSYSKLGPWIREWKVLEDHLSGLEHLDPVLLASLNDWCGRLKQTYMGAARAEVEQLNATLADKALEIEEYKQQLNAQATQLSQAEDRHFAQTEQLLEVQNHLENARDELKQSHQREQAVTEKLSQWDTRQKEWTAREQQLEDKVDTIRKDSKAQLEAEIKRIGALYESSEARLMRDIDHLRQQLKEQEKQSHNDKQRLQGEVHKLQDAIRNKELALGDLTREKELKTAQLKESEQQKIEYQQHTSRLEEKNKTLQSQLVEQQQQQFNLEVSLGKIQAAFDSSKQLCEQLQRDNTALREQAAQLTREVGRLEASVSLNKEKA